MGLDVPVGGLSGDPSWADWAMGGVWLCRHLPDDERARPLLEGAVQFCLDWLVEDGPWLTTSPSTSPENAFRTPTGSRALSTGSTMDLALVRDLFERYLRLVPDQSVANALARLPGATVAADGTLREWSHDAEPVDPRHRHLSHLVGLYPLAQIDPQGTPDLAAAAARTLDTRGPGSTGWSLAWKAALRARLGDGARWARCWPRPSDPHGTTDRSRVASCPTSSRRTRRSRWTATSGSSPRWSRPSCSRTPTTCASCRRCRPAGRRGAARCAGERRCRGRRDVVGWCPARGRAAPVGGRVRTVVHGTDRRTVRLVAGTAVRLEGWAA